ncbi:MAG: hypothetical protein EPO68_05215 [Planctomycetota bacterium]|nr:MAG: hypothetical protein EPO68_05215 [Planctomycetota bacterium]
MDPSAPANPKYHFASLAAVDLEQLTSAIQSDPLLAMERAPDVLAVDGSWFEVQVIAQTREMHFQVSPEVVFGREGDRLVRDADYAPSVQFLRRIVGLARSLAEAAPAREHVEISFTKERVVDSQASYHLLDCARHPESLRFALFVDDATLGVAGPATRPVELLYAVTGGDAFVRTSIERGEGGATSVGGAWDEVVARARVAAALLSAGDVAIDQQEASMHSRRLCFRMQAPGIQVAYSELLPNGADPVARLRACKQPLVAAIGRAAIDEIDRQFDAAR